MQQDKDNKKISELKKIFSDSEKMTSALTDMIAIFKVPKYFKAYNFLKSKGIAVSSLLGVLLILPFYGACSVLSLFKSGINKKFEGKKDVYYDIKNSEKINWRIILIMMAKRFKYLIKNNIDEDKNGTTAFIFDDTLIKKTGIKTERVSYVNDHVSGTFVLGYKLLVCGFWDGKSFIPLDFSLHREKGSRQIKVKNAYNKIIKQEATIINNINNIKTTLEKKKDNLAKSQQLFDKKPTKTNKTRLEKNKIAVEKTNTNLEATKKKLVEIQKLTKKAKHEKQQCYHNESLFGLTEKQRQEQHKKEVEKGSFGYKRRKETDISKNKSMFKMLSRAIKHGFVANYILTDSWFFSKELVTKTKELKNGKIKLISMVKINNQIFTDLNGKQMSVKNIPELYKDDMQRCRKLKSKYIKVECNYDGVRVNLFFIKMGKSKHWHLLLTTDLKLTFIKLIEVYQIRWTIEVFFKECKQYLNIENCKSSNFDAQIADITISMIQYIMLIYYKRINYMKSFGELFKDVSKELVEIDIVTKMLIILRKLIEILSEVACVDLMILQNEIFRNNKFWVTFEPLITQNNLEKAA